MPTETQGLFAIRQTTHERSKQWYQNGCSRKVKITNIEAYLLRILKFTSFKTVRRFVAVNSTIDSVRRQCVFLTTALKPGLNETKL